MRDSSRRSIPWRRLLGAGLLAFGVWAVVASLRGDGARPYAERALWTTPTGGRVNYSVFTFRDRNRDGIYDLGDRPLAGVAVDLAGPRGGRASGRSNLNGFANFALADSWLQLGARIRSAGDYSFSVPAPPGWSITSGNAVQTSRFVELPGAIGDLVSLRPTTPVGLAPRLTVAGRLLRWSAGGGLVPAAGVVTGSGPSGLRVEVAAGADGGFEFDAPPGEWLVSAAESASAERVERRVVVRDLPVRLAALLFAAPASAGAAAEVGAAAEPAAAAGRVLDFEDFDVGAVTKIPNGYAGLDWDNLNAIELAFAEGEGYSNGALSGRHVAYCGSGHPVTIASRAGGRPFDFLGAAFAVGWERAEGETLIVQATRAGVALPEERLRLSSLGPVRFQADYRAVDRVVLRTERYWQFVVDDLEVGAAAAPLP